tara:strand:- start:13543 stop:13911 length:369 start_codon:yes stop_codon:yes gene_type:complete
MKLLKCPIVADQNIGQLTLLICIHLSSHDPASLFLREATKFDHAGKTSVVRCIYYNYTVEVLGSSSLKKQWDLGDDEISTFSLLSLNPSLTKAPHDGVNDALKTPPSIVVSENYAPHPSPIE